jgi:hypothetical protein
MAMPYWVERRLEDAFQMISRVHCRPVLGWIEVIHFGLDSFGCLVG